ncbi:MAG TPA: nickel-binding protein [Acidimicrobiia bacterium]|nr:nickel-binding protein [Acidimicrobiia bacterium]
MPLYMDRHDVPGATAEETARNHAADLKFAAQFGVEFFSYWHDSTRGLVFCFARAPGEEAVAQAHRAAHGLVPTEIIEVSESDVVRFLGKVHDPVDASEVTSAFRAICFTDLVGSTELLDRLGQSEYMVLLTQHDLIIREALIRWKGREVKHTGDGFMVVFEDVDKALGWSLDVRDSFERRSDLDVRVGMAAGEPVDHDDDIFGAAVTMANRICASAGPEEIYVSEVVRDLGVEKGFRFDGGRTEVLKGFSEPVTIYKLLGT